MTSDAPKASRGENAGRSLRSYSTWQLLLLAVLLIAALGSLAHGVRDGLRNGEDFQWSGAHFLGEGVDPWKAYIENDPQHPFLMAQFPNYLPELYVLLLPLGRMTFAHARALWCGANLVFLAVSLDLLTRIFRLTAYSAAIMTGVLLIGAPLRVTLNNGQQCLFVLCCFLLAYSVVSRMARGLMLGAGFAKYTFAPILVMVDALRMRWMTLVCAGAPILAGLLIVQHMTGSPLGRLLVEPVQAAKLSVSPGYADVMTATEMALPRFGLSYDRIFSIASALGLICAAGCALYLARKRFKPELELALIVVLTLACFKHVGYDFIFLVLPIAALLASGQALQGEGGGLRWLAWAAILYLELVGSIKHKLNPAESLPFLLSNLAALLLIAWALVRLEGMETRAAASESV